MYFVHNNDVHDVAAFLVAVVLQLLFSESEGIATERASVQEHVPPSLSTDQTSQAFSLPFFKTPEVETNSTNMHCSKLC